MLVHVRFFHEPAENVAGEVEGIRCRELKGIEIDFERQNNLLSRHKNGLSKQNNDFERRSLTLDLGINLRRMSPVKRKAYAVATSGIAYGSS